MADSPLQTHGEPQDSGEVNNYPLWRESPEMVCWQRAICEWLGGGGGSLKYAVVVMGAHTPSKKPRSVARKQAYIA
jgi:hypothetical protein